MILPLVRSGAAHPGVIPRSVIRRRPAAHLYSTPTWRKWFTQTADTRAPAWRTEVTPRSGEMFTEYSRGTYLRHLGPPPLLRAAAAGDHLVLSEPAITAFATAHEPGSGGRQADYYQPM